jgi:probable HAF family extracellular repeat protein
MLGFDPVPGPNVSSGQANSVNADGSVVVGFNSNANAFRWTAATGIVSLGSLPGAPGSTAHGVSGDGSVVVGDSFFPATQTHGAFRWTPSTGMVSLGVLTGDNGSFAYGVSADGSAIVGSSYSTATSPIGQQAFRWTAATGMVGLGYLPGMDHSVANGVNANGAVVVGSSYFPNLQQEQAFRWIAATGMVGLGYLPGGVDSRAKSICFPLPAAFLARCSSASRFRRAACFGSTFAVLRGRPGPRLLALAAGLARRCPFIATALAPALARHTVWTLTPISAAIARLVFSGWAAMAAAARALGGGPSWRALVEPSS